MNRLAVAMNITLVGMKHCGKSTLGTALAERWHCQFHDVDQLIEESHANHTNQRQNVREIFAMRGEEYFCQLEAEVVRELERQLQTSPDCHVVALGGRTPLNRRVDPSLGSVSRVVYLEVSPEEMFERVMRAGLPPFIDRDHPREHFHALYQERVPHYRRWANLTVNLDGLDPAAALEKLCQALADHDSHDHPGSTGC